MSSVAQSSTSPKYIPLSPLTLQEGQKEGELSKRLFEGISFPSSFPSPSLQRDDYVVIHIQRKAPTVPETELSPLLPAPTLRRELNESQLQAALTAPCEFTGEGTDGYTSLKIEGKICRVQTSTLRQYGKSFFDGDTCYYILRSLAIPTSRTPLPMAPASSGGAGPSIQEGPEKEALSRADLLKLLKRHPLAVVGATSHGYTHLELEGRRYLVLTQTLNENSVLVTTSEGLEYRISQEQQAYRQNVFGWLGLDDDEESQLLTILEGAETHGIVTAQDVRAAKTRMAYNNLYQEFQLKIRTFKQEWVARLQSLNHVSFEQRMAFYGAMIDQCEEISKELESSQQKVSGLKLTQTKLYDHVQECQKACTYLLSRAFKYEANMISERLKKEKLRVYGDFDPTEFAKLRERESRLITLHTQIPNPDSTLVSQPLSTSLTTIKGALDRRGQERKRYIMERIMSGLCGLLLGPAIGFGSIFAVFGGPPEGEDNQAIAYPFATFITICMYICLFKCLGFECPSRRD